MSAAEQELELTLDSSVVQIFLERRGVPEEELVWFIDKFMEGPRDEFDESRYDAGRKSVAATVMSGGSYRALEGMVLKPLGLKKDRRRGLFFDLQLAYRDIFQKWFYRKPFSSSTSLESKCRSALMRAHNRCRDEGIHHKFALAYGRYYAYDGVVPRPEVFYTRFEITPEELSEFVEALRDE